MKVCGFCGASPLSLTVPVVSEFFMSFSSVLTANLIYFFCIEDMMDLVVHLDFF